VSKVGPGTRIAITGRPDVAAQPGAVDFIQNLRRVGHAVLGDTNFAGRIARKRPQPVMRIGHVQAGEKPWG